MTPSTHALSARVPAPQRGQALSEFILLVAAVILPLMICLPMVARYQDIQFHTQLASRYLAFESTTQSGVDSRWKTPAQLAFELRSRFFGAPGGAIVSDAGAVVGTPEFWRDPAGAPLVANPLNDASFTTRQDGTGTGVADGFDAASDRAPFAPNFIFQVGNPIPPGPEVIDLQARGVYTANVSVALANLPGGIGAFGDPANAPFDAIDLRIAAHTSTVTAPWAARDWQEVDAHLNSFSDADAMYVFPSRTIRDASAAVLDPLVPVIESPGPIPAPKVGQLDFWHDIVPGDRLY